MGLTLARRGSDESGGQGRRRRRRPHLLGEVLIVIILVKVYDYVRDFAANRTATARRHGQTVLQIERALHIDIEHSLNNWLAGIRWLTLVTAYWYQFFHIGVTLVVLAWCYISRPVLYRAARNALIITNVVGLTVFVVLPVMPPRMLPDGFTDSVAAAGFGSPEGGPVQADQYAAMPSLHLAWATWTLLVALALLSGRRWRMVCIAYPLGTAFVVMSTGNHYMLDVVAGIAVALAAAWVTGMRRAAGESEVEAAAFKAAKAKARDADSKAADVGAPDTDGSGGSGSSAAASLKGTGSPTAAGSPNGASPGAASPNGASLGGASRGDDAGRDRASEAAGSEGAASSTRRNGSMEGASSGDGASADGALSDGPTGGDVLRRAASDGGASRGGASDGGASRGGGSEDGGSENGNGTNGSRAGGHGTLNGGMEDLSPSPSADISPR